MCLFVLQVRAAGETGLKGVIKGSGILCFCAKCKGVEVSVWFLFSSLVFGEPINVVVLMNHCVLYFYVECRFLHPLCLSCMLAVQINVHRSIFTWRMGTLFVMS